MGAMMVVVDAETREREIGGRGVGWSFQLGGERCAFSTNICALYSSCCLPGDAGA